jgi:hypothetical protein
MTKSLKRSELFIASRRKIREEVRAMASGENQPVLLSMLIPATGMTADTTG